MEKYLKGYVRVRLTGYGPERFLNLCQYHQIAIWGLAYVQGAYEFHMYRKDFIRCRSLTRKTKTRLHIVEKKGLPALLRRWRKRKALAVGLLLAAGLMYQLTGHIWDIQFSGNTACTDEMLAELLDTHDIVHGMKKSQVSCEEIEQLIRSEYGEITWVSAHISGTRLLVQVKENSGAIQPEEEADSPCDLVADKNGIITEIIVRNGVPLVKAGDVVQEGQVLISGSIPVMNDSQEVVRYELVRADGDVTARTAADYSDTFPTVETVTKETGKTSTSWYIGCMGRRAVFSFGDPGYALSSQTSQEYQLRILKDWYLPLCVGTIRTAELTRYEKRLTREEAEEKVQKNLKDYFEKTEEKGVQILENHVTMKYSADMCEGSGKIIAQEPIGKQQVILTDRLAEETEEPDELNGDIN